ncbi:MAG: hypothetical protein QXW10_04210 [Candidatus Micrarchaeaceae archaeon]
MKAQTSIEFLLILAAVAGMSVTFIYAYEHASSQMNSIYGYLNATGKENNFTMPNPAGVHARAYMYVAPIMYLNGTGSVEVIAALPQNASSVEITPASNAFDFLPSDIYANSTFSPYIAYFQAMPRQTGKEEIAVIVKITDGNAIMYEEANASTYVYGQNAPPGSNATLEPISASVKQNNDSVLYGLSQKEGVPKLEETYHCTYLNFWYTPLSFKDQCGNAAWDFSIFTDGCYDSGSTGRTYCVYEDPTGTYTQNVTYSSGYLYNATLSLAYENSAYVSNMNNKKTEAALLEGNAVAGNAVISGQIIGQAVQQPSSMEVVDSNGSAYPVGIDAYDAYEQYFLAMEGKLGYYNGSGVDSSEFSSIQQSVSAYNAYLSKFLGTPADKSCNVTSSTDNDYLSCPAAAPLDFENVTAYLNNISVNRTILADGSTINVR